MLRTISAAVAAVSLGLPVLAGDVTVSDAYARSSNPKVGAAFMILSNAGSEDDTLVSASSDVAMRVELHTHVENAEGVMRMVEIEDGIPVTAGATHALKRGGDHLMMMGLVEPLQDGGSITVTLTFEKAGDVKVVIPVDNTRKPRHGS